MDIPFTMQEYLNYTSFERFSETYNIDESINVTHLNQNITTNNTKHFEWIDEVARTVIMVSFPIIIVLGTIGNLITFVVMRRGSLKRSSTCFYMAILALADTGKYM